MTKPFSHTSGSPSAKIVFVGEAWGEHEEVFKLPFVGYSGQEFFRLLGEAFPSINPRDHALICSMMNNKNNDLWVRERESWLCEAGFLITNVFNSRPPANKIEAYLGPDSEAIPGLPYYQRGKFFRKEFEPEVERLWEEISSVRPNLIVPMGNTATWAITGNAGISALRGTITPAAGPISGIKVLPTYHPAAVMRQWNWRPILLADLMKAEREGKFPEIIRPRRQILVHPTFSEIKSWMEASLGSRLLAVDIETKLGQITDIGFAASRDFALVITFVDTKKPGNRFYESEGDEIFAWQLVRAILEGPNPKLFQNGLYDLQYLAKMGIRPKNCGDDTMLLHHSMFPEMQKGLGFLGSIYTNEAAWKLMRNHKEELKANE